MHRFYCPPECIRQDSINITDKEQVHHIRSVLRLRPEETVVVFDNTGQEHFAAIKKISPQAILLKIKQTVFPAGASKVKLTLACAIPKNSRFEDIVDKLTQLGVERIIPLITERVIVKLDEKAKLAKLKRWQAVALSASKQSQRSTLPVIELPNKINAVINASSDDALKLIPALFGERKTLAEVLAANKAKNIIALIGPEGDFTQEEYALALKAGFIPVTLGNLVLRVETAAVAVASCIKLKAAGQQASR